MGVFGFRSQPLEGALLGILVAIVATAMLARFAVGLETPRWLERRISLPLRAPEAAADRA